MKNHLHIGRNNIVGRAFERMPNVLCRTHDEVSNMEDFNFDLISISAFDPIKKTLFVKNPSCFIKMVSRFPEASKIVYFSTARVFGKILEKQYSNYVKNKLVEESVLSSLFENLSIFYLPNLIPKYPTDNSPFFDIVKKNYKNNRASFDVSPKSTWNFIYPSDIPLAIEDLRYSLPKQILLSETSISVTQIVEKLNKHKELNVLFSENRVEHYPNRDLCSCIYTANDAGRNLTWITDMMDYW